MKAIPYEQVPDQTLEIPFVQLMFVVEGLMKCISNEEAERAYIRFTRTGRQLDVYVGDMRLSDPFQQYSD